MLWVWQNKDPLKEGEKKSKKQKKTWEQNEWTRNKEKIIITIMTSRLLGAYMRTESILLLLPLPLLPLLLLPPPLEALVCGGDLSQCSVIYLPQPPSPPVPGLGNGERDRCRCSQWQGRPAVPVGWPADCGKIKVQMRRRRRRRTRRKDTRILIR